MAEYKAIVRGNDIIHLVKKESLADRGLRAEMLPVGKRYQNIPEAVCGWTLHWPEFEDFKIVHLDEEDIEKFVQKDGEVIGKLCGNCRKQV